MFIQLYDKICQGLVHNFVIQYKHDTGNGIRGEINFIVIHDKISKNLHPQMQLKLMIAHTR